MSFDPPQTPRKRPPVDRFVPHREGVKLNAAFSAVNSARSPHKHRPSSNDDPTDIEAIEAQEARSVYQNVLKMEMFGSEISLQNSSSSLSPEKPQIPQLPPPNNNNNNLHQNSLVTNQHTLNPQISNVSTRLSQTDAFSELGNISPSHSLNSLRSFNSGTSLSLPPSPRKHVPSSPSNSNNLLKFSPKKLLRSDSDLSDISLGGGMVNSFSNTSLRPESRDYLLAPRPPRRVFKQTPVKTLDAPGLTKNFYLNVLEWGNGSKIAVALHNFVYVWDQQTSETLEICKLSQDFATSVSWMKNQEYLAVGTDKGNVLLYDAVTGQRLRNMGGHSRRCGTLSFNNHVLSSGSQDATILHRDCRVKDSFIKRLEGHYGEVCGLKWNVDLQQLASGGNDNKLKIWSGVNNASSGEPLYEFDEHTSAVKALAWSPHQRGLLASGGGFCDQSIWFWNTQTGKALNSVNTGSQVCNLVWNPEVKELVSSHGNMYNDVVVWQYPSMKPLTRLRAHGSRALHLAISPQGDTLVTGAGDETLRLWSMFDDEKVEKGGSFLSSYGQLR